MRKILTQITIILASLLATACQDSFRVYSTREQCLSRIIDQCKANGWKYATTHPVCVRAAHEGIYGLSPAQLSSCGCIVTSKHS